MDISYSVVKFIVKVKLIENSVKSHVGSVYVTQKRMVGRTLRMDRITRPNKPKVEDGVISAIFMAVSEVCAASAALDTTAAELLTSDVTAAGSAMMGNDRAVEGWKILQLGTSRGTLSDLCTSSPDSRGGSSAHGVCFLGHVWGICGLLACDSGPCR